MTNPDKDIPQLYGGFPSRESQLANTAFRGMESDASLQEVLEYEQAEQDLVNAAHFGYPVGTPSSEIALELPGGGGIGKSE